MTKKSLTFNLLMLFIILSYFIVALIGTNGFSLFNGDNAAHIIQADYVKENPEQMFGWSRISYAGYPLFFFYQPLSHLILAFLFNFGDIFLIFRIVSIILFTLISVSFYFSLRRIHFTKTESLFGSIMPLLIFSFTGYGLEPNAFFAWGLFTQLSGTVLFPITVSQFYLSIKTNKDRTLAILLFSLLVLTHSILGFLSLMIGLLVVIVDISEFKKRFLNYIHILFFSLLVISFWIFPILIYKELYGNIIKPSEYVFSFGFLKVFVQFISGNILDTRRPFPILTTIAFLGFFLILYFLLRNFSFKQDKIKKGLSDKSLEKERFIFYGLILSFILFSGGEYLKNLPIFSFLELHRFIYALHFFLILLMAYVLGFAVKKFGKTAIFIIAILLFLASITTFNEIYQRQIDINTDSPFEELKQVGLFLKDLPEGRIYIDMPINKHIDPLIYYYSKKPLLYRFSLGSQDSLSTQYIYNISPANDEELDNYLDKYNVKYLLVSSSVDFPYDKKVFKTLNLYFVNTTGYFFVPDQCGELVSENNKNEVYYANLSLRNNCDILFKMTYSPFWKAYSNKTQLNIDLVEDSLIGIHVPRNTKTVIMRYEDINYRKYLFAFGLLILVVCFILEKHILIPNSFFKKHD